MKMHKTELVELLNVANDLRRIKGDKELDDLPVSTERDIYSCIIANAFNYDCTVAPGNYADNFIGEITFKSRADRAAYLNVVPDAEVIDRDNWGDNVTIFSATLPERFNQIALDFDNGIYPQYSRQALGLPVL